MLLKKGIYYENDNNSNKFEKEEKTTKLENKVKEKIITREKLEKKMKNEIF